MTNLFMNLGFPRSYAGDISLLLMMLLAGIALMFIVKKTKIGAFAFAIYTAYFITEAADFDFINTYIIKSAVFLVIALGLHYSLFKPTVIVKLGGGNIMRWIKRTIISFTIIGFIASIILGWMPAKEAAGTLSPLGLKVFTAGFAKLFWALAPIVVLLIVKRREE